MWEDNPDGMRIALTRHEKIIKEVVEQFGGYLALEQGEGDSTFSVYQEATKALLAAIEIKERLALERWPEGILIRVRSGLHCGVADMRDRTYYGRAVNRAARVRAIAHGGQTILTRSVKELLDPKLCPELRDHGYHRLKDLLEPVHIYEVHGPEQFPSLNSLSSNPTNLPIFLTPFIGRAQTVSVVSKLIQENRLLTILALGGMGKTRLALQTAAQVSSDFSGGVFFHALDSTSTVDSSRAVIEALHGELAQGNWLLVLDNCEEELTVAQSLAADLLTRHTNLHLLVTSRQKLRVAGEYVFGLEPLWYPSSKAPTIDEVHGSEAVQLLVERAGASAVNLTIDSKNYLDVSALCRHLNGLPLAIELAAPALRFLSPAALLRKLSKSMDVLRTSGKELGTRHQALSAVIESCFEAMSKLERETLLALSLINGVFPLELAEAYCEDLTDQQLLEVVGGLCDKSLLHQYDGKGLYLLELIRVHCETLLSPATCDHMEGLLLKAICNCEAIGTSNFNLLSQGLALARKLGDATAGVALCRRAWHYWRAQSLLREGRRWVEDFIAIGGLSSRDLGQALTIAATLAYYQGDLAIAQHEYSESLEAYKASGDQAKILGAHSNLGLIFVLQKRYSEALPFFEIAADGLRKTDDQKTLLNVLANIGMCRIDAGFYEDAISALREAVDLSGSEDVDLIKVLTHNNLCLAYCRLGQLSQAVAACEVTAGLLGEIEPDRTALEQFLGVVHELCGAEQLSSPTLAAPIQGAIERLKDSSAITSLSDPTFLSRLSSEAITETIAILRIMSRALEKGIDSFESAI